MKIFTNKLTIVIIFSLLANCAFAQSGIVFRDFNANGTKDTNEPLVSGILVKAYNAAGTLCASSTSAGTTSPNYNLPTTCSGQVRVEFEIPATATKPCDPVSSIDYTSGAGTTYGSSVQFVAAGAANTNFAINNPEDFWSSTTQPIPQLMIPCYVNGTTGQANKDEPAIVRFGNDQNGISISASVVAKISEVGTVWGNSYQKEKDRFFYGAFLKRHSGFGTRGPGGVYIVEKVSGNYAVNGSFDLQGVVPSNSATAIDLGTVTRTTTLTGAANNAANDNYLANSATNKTEPSRDMDAFGKVGKMSFGDLDIDEKSNTLFLVNLFQRRLITVDVSAGTSTLSGASAATLQPLTKAYDIMSLSGLPSCTAGDLRPWGLKIYRGKGYLGVVCSANNGVAARSVDNLKGYILSFDPNNIGAGFTQVLTLNLKYPNTARWKPWADTWAQTGLASTFTPGNTMLYFQPIISDIEFDEKGGMTIAMMDRFGHQIGFENYLPISGNTSNDSGGGYGDMLYACYDAATGTWTMEGGAGCVAPNNAGAINEGYSGTGLKEFYNDQSGDAFADNGMGAVAKIMGTNNMIGVVVDPHPSGTVGATYFNTGGVQWYNNTTGIHNQYAKIYAEQYFLLGKASGLGDIEPALNTAPIEIGNRVWKDTDNDGIQDANEAGIANVTIEIYDGTTLIAATTTDPTGNWYFNNTNVTDGSAATGVQAGLQPNKTYTIKIGSADWTAGAGIADLAGLKLTTANSTATSGLLDLSDNDATLVSNVPTIAYTTGSYGQNNHTLDIGLTQIPPCSLSVVSTSISTCYRDAAGNPMVTVNFSIGWSNPSNDSISVTFNGVTKYITGVGTSGVASRSMNFVVPAGYTGTGIAQIVGDAACSVTSSTITTVNDCSPALVACSSDPSRIGGVVFQDYNEDGSKAIAEVGKGGVVVKVFDCDGNLVGTTTSDADGNWSVSGLDFSSEKYRVEFSIPNSLSDYQPSAHGISNATDVQFVSAASCNVNFGVNVPANYCEAIPPLVTVCYVTGLPAAGEHVLVTFPFPVAASTGANSLADANETGSTWGIAYARGTRTIYTSTFLKRHVGILNDKLGMIYTQNWADTTQAPLGWLDVTTLGINIGQSLVPTNVARALGSKTTPNYDAVVYDLIGKVGIGDIDISTDEKTLYFVNLFDKKLYAIDIASKTVKSGFPATIPNTCSSGTGEMRPFGLKYFDNKVYVGTVCDGQTSQNNSDLYANVYSFDGAAMTNVLNFPLNYLKGNPSTATAETNIGWFPWTSAWPTNIDISVAQPTRGYAISYPQPILSDIEFDSNGDMLLGFMDRFGHQSGAMNYNTSGSSTKQFSAVAGGDILRASNNDGEFILESNGTAGDRTSAGVNNSQGPGGGEFYFADAIGSATNGHQENILGGLAVNWVLDRVAASVMDPRAFLTGGILTLNNTTGARGTSQTLYTTSYVTGSASSTFGKAAGIGDVESICQEAPKEIGNRIWKDTDADGVQDACEEPLKNVHVSLYKSDGTLVATTTTDSLGAYYFKDYPNATTGVFDTLVAGQKYYVVVGKNGQFSTSNNQLTDPNSASVLKLTTQNSTVSNGNDQNDSDAFLASGLNAAFNGFPVDTVTIGSAGYVNHTLDFGFTCSPAIVTATVTQATCNGATANSDASIAFTSSGADKYTIVSGATSSATYATATAITANAGSLTAIINPAVATQYTIRVFNGSDACFKDTTVTLNPKTCVATVCSVSLSAVPTVCNPTTNAYSVSGTLTFANAPTTGTLTVSDGTVTQVFNAPFTSTQAYTLSGLTSNGASHTVTAIFSATPTCTNTITYTAPASCLCPAQDNKICAGESYTLTAQTGMTGYQWYRIVGTDTTVISGATNQIYTATTTGTFIWKAKDAAGCDIKLCCPVVITPGNCYGSIGDYVWSDTNNNGQQDGTESPIAGVKVYLLNASGVKIDSTVTNSVGKYLFDSLLTGSYKVQFVAPAGTIASKQNTGADVSDSDANKAGLSQLINIDTTKLPTDTLRNNQQIDAGFVPVGSLGDYVFNDKNGNGVQEATDTPIAGIKVYLLDATTGAKLDSTLTDALGKYTFDSLLTGDYKVKFVIPAGSEASPKIAGTDTTKDSNINPDGTTDTVSINTALPLGDVGRNNNTIDAGIKPAYGSIGDYVWTDQNNNGQQDGTEAPIAGVKVYLLNASGVKIDSTVTNASGKYLFDSLLTGSYKVQFVAPAGTIASKQNTGADVSDSDANKAGLSQLINIDTTKLPTDTLRNNPQIDAGFVPVGSLGDYVFNDKNGNGVQEATDMPIAGIKVYLLDATTGAKLDSTLTDALGKYTFDSLLTGDYKVKFVIPAGSEASPKIAGTDTTKDSNINPDGTTDTVSINTALPLGDGGRNNPTIDAGIKPAYGSIGDYVWTDQNNNGQQDGTETPIAGVKVYLLDGVTGAKLDSTLTNSAGKYLFDSLLTGSYKVKFVAPAGTIAAKQNMGADVSDSDANKLGISQLINIDTTKLPTDTLRNNPQIDAGFVPVGSIGDYVFEDLDKSNTQTAGDTPLAGVKIYLLDATTGAKLDSTTTDAAGLYLFDSLVAGNYKVQFVAPSGTLLVGKTSGTDIAKDSNPDPTTGITDAVTIDTTQPIGSPARDNRDVDAGIKLIPAYGSIGDYVWSDVNNNGQQDGTETPIVGVKVYLYDASGTTKLDSTLTNSAGKYLFDSLLTGSYKVKFVAPAGTFPSKQNTGADVSDSDASKLGWSQVVNIDATKAETDTLRNNPQIDAGFVPFGSIGDYVFDDKDNSNTQTTGDLPVEGVKVYLLDATTGAKLDSTVTNAAGLYKFDSLIAGNYKVQVVPPTGMLVVTKDSGTDDTKDSDIDATGTTGSITVDVTKPIGDPLRDITSVDAGIKGNPQYGSIGDYVWFDKNNNGQQDGTELPIVGVKVYLYNAAGTTKLDSTVTDATGKYLFDSLTTGGYKVKFEAPAGTFPAKQNTGADVTDSDANKLGFSQVVNIDVTKLTTDTLRNNPQIDAGFVPFGSLGDYVFEDKDNSNTQTAGDLPISGVKVYLLDATTGAKLDSTITDGAGKYLFDSLVAGNYKVQFVAPSGSLLVTKISGTDVTKDSNPDPTTGITDAITIDTTQPLGSPARDNRDVDAGVKAAPQFGSIGDYVWTDTNNNGQQDATESPIAGVKVYLYDATGTTKLDSTLTDATGKYLFDSLITAGYKVKFVAPAGTIAAKQNTGADVSDSDANKLGWSQVINIDASLADTDTLRNNPQIDAGFVPVGSIGDYVFIDKDNSNTQTAGDLPMEGVKVYLLDATTGAKLDSTLTNASGLYKFDSLIAGNYKVQFVVPTGMTAVTKDSGTDDTKDSDIDPTGTTGTVTVDTTKPIGDPLRDITSVDAGLKGVPQYGSIGDYVWFDNNNNGQQDGTENPIAGVKVYLYDATGTTKLDSALTDATGKYLFDSLLTGGYKVKFVAPTGTIPAKQNTGADVSDSDANKLGWSQVVNIDVTKLVTDTLRNNPQIDAGFVPFGSIGDYVFQDKDNSNTQTVSDTPIPCIVVYLLDATTGAKLDSTMTDISGKYQFDSLLAGNYKVQFVAPIGGTFVTPLSGGDVIKDSNPDAAGLTDVVIIDPTQPIGSPARDNRDVDAGLKIVGPFGSIGDYVWSDVNNNGQQDGTEAPIAGVKVYLYDGTGTMIMDSTVTDAAGKYLFDSLFTADYRVKFVAPAGTIASKQNTGADVTDSDVNKAGWSQIISIDVTKLATDTLRNNPQIDAGFVPVGSIGDYVFEDKDNSNTQTAGDAPIQGVKVYLLNATTGAKLDSTITDGAGKYLFDSLVAGNYKVQFVAPSGTDLVTKTSGTDVTKDSNPDPMTGITDTVTIITTQPIGSPARDNRDVDAGIKASLAYGSLGDYVWTDTNNNGQQDAAEAPIAGVKVYLYDASGTTKLDSTLTNAAGKYLFDSLLTGSYKVKFVAPTGTIAAKQNIGADVTDSDSNKIGWSQVVNIDVTLAETDTLRNNPKIDAGFVPVGSIGDYVFNDKDNSNTQTAGDLPIAGVKVYLLDATTGAKLDSTITDSNGLYKFDSLIAGNYKVQVVAPTGMTVVTKDSGTDDTKDSDIDPTGTTGIVNVDTTKPIGDPLRDITNVDAGLKGNPAYGSIGNFVWTDQNNNGQQDGTETPIEGVKIYLYDGTGTVLLDSTLTNAAGNYLFDSLLTGSYKVKFVAPVGTMPAKQNTGADVSDSDANKLGWSQVVNIDVTKLATDTLRNNPQIDAGFVPVGSIGDYVFNDKDDSKTQTAGDLPIGGVKVYLLNATTGAKLDSTITDGAGKYLFDSLVAGNYKVQFVAPVGTNLVTKTAGTDVTKDSNPDPATGITDAVTIDTTQPIGSPARDNRDVDAGIKGQLQYGSIGDYVWTDTNNNGQQDASEAPITGVKVYLYDAAGLVKIDSALTNASGKYLFDSLLTGGYKVKFVAPAGTIAAKQNTGADVTDSDANKLGWSQVVNIDVTLSSTDTLRNNPKIDAGFVPVGSIGDYVFVDNDNSSTQTVGDTPVAGVKVYLLDAVTGAKLDSTVTNINGLYKFDSLVAGNYKVQFVAPTGASLVTKDSGADDTKDSDADATGTTGIVTVDTTKPVGDAARDITSVDAGLSFKVDLRLTKVAVGDCKRKIGDVVSFKVMVKRQDLIITDVTTTVKDSLSANFEFVSATATEGTYSNTTGIWSGIILAKGDSAVLTVNARIRQGVAGLACNDAWIQTMDKGDFDSIAGNKIESEDDFARACVSVPLPVCTARGEKAELTAPAGYTNYQWFKNGQLITGATSSTYMATTFGEYTVTVNNGSCPSTGCCPIYVEEFCDCPPVICVPYAIQKTKSKK